MRYQPKNVQWPPISLFLKSLGVDIKVHIKPPSVAAILVKGHIKTLQALTMH